MYLSPIDLAAVTIPVRRAPRTKKRVIFARLDGLGDYVIWTGTFGALEEMYPASDYERILILDERWRELAEQAELFEQKIFLNVGKLVSDPVYRFRTIRNIRSLDADIFVNAKLTRDFVLVDPLVRSSGSIERIGCSGRDNRMTGLQNTVSRRWYTRLTSPPLPGEHEFDSNLRFLDELRPGMSRASLPRPRVIGGTSAPQSPKHSDDYVLVFGGASSEEKRWPPEKFAETASFISKEYGYRIILAGGQNDHEFANRFAGKYNGKFENTIGHATLNDLEKLVSGARLVLSNDTGAAHISAMLKIPTVVLTPGNQVGWYFPYPESLKAAGVRQLSVFHEMPCFGCGWNCIYKLGPDKPKPCVENISVEDVKIAITETLRAGRSCQTTGLG